MPPRRRKLPDESAEMSSDPEFDSDDLLDDEDEYVPVSRAQRGKGQTPVPSQETAAGTGGSFMKQCSKCKEVKDAESNFWKVGQPFYDDLPGGVEHRAQHHVQELSSETVSPRCRYHAFMQIA